MVWSPTSSTHLSSVFDSNCWSESSVFFRYNTNHLMGMWWEHNDYGDILWYLWDIHQLNIICWFFLRMGDLAPNLSQKMRNLMLDRQEWFQFQFDISSPREENQWDLAAQDVPKPMPFVVSWDCLAKDNRRETDPVWENISRALALKASGVFLWRPKRLQPFWGSIYRSFPDRYNDHSKVEEMIYYIIWASCQQL